MNLNQITLPSIDVKQSAKFYENLGFKMIVEAYPRYVRFECPEGDATFSIHLVEQLPQVEGTAIYFENERLDELVKELQSSGVVFDELPQDKSWLWREARLRDPDNNLIILYHAGINRKNPPWKI